MIDNINFKGNFKIQCIDENNIIIDEWEDNNMIMETARISMSEIFANLNSNTFINVFKIGTMGHIGDSILIPKSIDDGFTKERDRLFSEVYETDIEIGDTISILRKNDVFFINATNPELIGYYRYLNNNTTNYLINDGIIAITSEWEFLGEDPPYFYTINFQLPMTNSDESGTLANNIIEDDATSGSSIRVLQNGSSVTFTIDIATAAANKQTETTSVFTEAALYANSRIFAMKTFKAKVKDSTVLLRIVWTITF